MSADYTYAEPKRGLLMSTPWRAVEAAFWILRHDPHRVFAAGSAQWARENGLERWP